MRFLLLAVLLLPVLTVAQVFEPLSGFDTSASQSTILQEQAALSFQQANYAQAAIQYQALSNLEPHNQEALDGLFASWDALGNTGASPAWRQSYARPVPSFFSPITMPLPCFSFPTCPKPDTSIIKP